MTQEETLNLSKQIQAAFQTHDRQKILEAYLEATNACVSSIVDSVMPLDSYIATAVLIAMDEFRKAIIESDPAALEMADLVKPNFMTVTFFKPDNL